MRSKLKNYFLFLAITISGCASMQPSMHSIEIDLLTVDSQNESIDAVCSLYSETTKIDVLAPKKIIFNTSCSAINIVCKAGSLIGEYGIMKTINEDAAEDFLLNSGIGYIFDRALDTVTPLGTLINFMGDDEEVECSKSRKITVVLE